MKQDPENYWEQIERLEVLIKGAELKAGLIFSFHSVVLGLFFDRFDEIKAVFFENTLNTVLLGIWILFVVISGFYSIQCFIPRINLKYDKNVFFFGDAVNKFENVKAFTKEFMAVCGDKERLFQQLSEQVHVESRVTNYKFKCVKRSVRYLAISLVAIIPVIVIGLINMG